MAIKMKLLNVCGLIISCSAVSISAQAVRIIDNDITKAVGSVVWHKQATQDPMQLIEKEVPKNSVSLFFIRPHDQDVEQSSANIAINDRFQVSLQPGSFSQVYSCTGMNMLSAQVTGLKTNDLLLQPQPFILDEGNTYFFYVDINDDNNSQTAIKQITKESAIEVLNNKKYQTHQITRVVPNCPVMVNAPAAPAKPLPIPVLEEKVSLELEVLFDNDKAIIKPEYFNEVAEVANFMKNYANTTAVIEGHTDSNASDSYNQKLSERRANAVKNMMINQFGIEPNRLSAIGYGESRPRATNATAEGRQLNRRVVAVIEERR